VAPSAHSLQLIPKIGPAVSWHHRTQLALKDWSGEPTRTAPNQAPSPFQKAPEASTLLCNLLPEKLGGVHVSVPPWAGNDWFAIDSGITSTIGTNVPVDAVQLGSHRIGRALLPTLPTFPELSHFLSSMITGFHAGSAVQALRVRSDCDRHAFVVRAALILFATGLGLLTETDPAGAQSRGVREDVYTVRAGDVLRIRVWPDSTMGGQFPVEETGLVYLPVLGEIPVAGTSLDVLRAQLRGLYGEVMRGPIVTVTPSFRVSVLGAIGSPGLYQVEPTETLFDLISRAGGLSANANAEELRVVRDGQVVLINAQSAIETGSAELALALRSGDRIVVPAKRTFNITNFWMGLQSVVLLFTIFTR